MDEDYPRVVCNRCRTTLNEPQPFPVRDRFKRPAFMDGVGMGTNDFTRAIGDGDKQQLGGVTALGTAADHPEDDVRLYVVW